MPRQKKCPKCTVSHRIYTHAEFFQDLKNLAKTIKASDVYPQLRNIFGVPSGGLIPARYLASWLDLKMILAPKDVGTRTLVVDDIAERGETILTMCYPFQVAVLWYDEERCLFVPQFYARLKKDPRWIQFPWETVETTHEKMYIPKNKTTPLVT